MRYPKIKRFFDVIFSISFLLCFSPLYLLIALLIKLTTPGPIFYLSPRVGKGGKVFQCYKFRTMREGAELVLSQLLLTDPLLKQEWDQFHKLKKDPRITAFGRYLRKTSLDELPQFWNVLRGDLSVVGPRPYFAAEIQEFLGPSADKILSVRPGITGLWQTSGRSAISHKERVDLEKAYVDNQSFLLDTLLLCKTIPILFFPKGAF